MDKYQESDQDQGNEFLVDIAFGKLSGYFISTSKGVDLDCAQCPESVWECLVAAAILF